MSGATLVVDIGNTSTSLGLYRDGRIRRVQRLPSGMRVPRGIGGYHSGRTGAPQAGGAVLCSVVPARTPRLAGGVAPTGRRARRRRSPIAAGSASGHLSDPASIGADRLANACGAVHRYGAPGDRGRFRHGPHL